MGAVLRVKSDTAGSAPAKRFTHKRERREAQRDALERLKEKE